MLELCRCPNIYGPDFMYKGERCCSPAQPDETCACVGVNASIKPEAAVI